MEPADLARVMTEGGTRVDAEQIVKMRRLIEKQPEDRHELLISALGLDGVQPQLNARTKKRTHSVLGME
jgi:copper homeostasis protein CutC